MVVLSAPAPAAGLVGSEPAPQAASESTAAVAAIARTAFMGFMRMLSLFGDERNTGICCGVG